MLGEICNTFANKVDALDAHDEDYPAHLRAAVLKLTLGASAHFTDYEHGELPALLERSRLVLAWLKAEAEAVEDRSRRYARQRAVVDLLDLCEGIRRFHAPGRRKAAEAAAFKAQIGDALRDLVDCE